MHFINLLRPKSWIKNFLVIAPLFFSLNLLDLHWFTNSLLAFAYFSLCASAVYILNDLGDIEVDKLHPRKKNRPLPSGKVKQNSAKLILILLLAISFTGSYFVNTKLLFILIAYFILNIAYTFALKHIPLIDVFSLSINFLLRILAGCVAIEVLPSKWIIAVTFFLSLFLGFIKRKSELLMIEDNSSAHRKSLEGYTIEMLNSFLMICASASLISYMFYTIDSEVIKNLGSDKLIYTSFFVLLGIFRFLQLSYIDKYKKEGDPTFLLLKDRFLQFSFLSWLISIGSLIYLL